MKKTILFLPFLLCLFQIQAQVFEPMDIFQLEHISDPQISPDGKHIIYARNYMDIMKDGKNSNLWQIDYTGKNHHPITTGNQNDYAPRWSPDGKQLAYISNKNDRSQIYLRWLENGAEAKLTNLQQSPGNLKWSPDGNWLSFTMFVEKSEKPFISLPAAPKGAKWAAPAKYIDKMNYRNDGGGYAKTGFRHLFVLSKDGGTPRQITSGDFNHGGDYSWSANSESIILSANRHDNHEFDPNNSELYEVWLADGNILALTKRQGPDHNPQVSPDGKLIAYTGLDDQYLGYQINHLYLMYRNGTETELLLSDFDRNIEDIKWSPNGSGIYFTYSDEGNTKLAFVAMSDKKMVLLAEDLGGLSLGRPYSGSQYSVGPAGEFVFTLSTPSHPADLAVGKAKGKYERLTNLNEDLFSQKKLGEVEEIWYTSSFDNQKIQGWICKPPNFDPSKKYPLILEIHGGPFANYGDRFSTEVQLYAAAGYVVLYTNPRGSSSYGSDFGNLIHHNYPNQDYDDLISGVDEVIKKGYVDEDKLYVTGGSGGGVLTAWIVGKTNRFQAAVVAKPVINWYSFVLTADSPGFFYKYWFPGKPWDYVDHYMKRSPISYAHKVTTPTMLLTGEVDYRTPISETEQYYTALKLSGVETAMVRIPEAGHGIAAKPSYLMSKVLHILGWFEQH